MKNNKKASLFETVTFDSYEAGRAFYESEKSKMKLSKIATLVSIPVSVISSVSLAAPSGTWIKTSAAADIIAYIVFALSIACSVVCLGFSGTFKYIGRVIKWSWLLIPIFPVDIFVCFMNSVLCIVCIFVFPLVPCLFGLYQRNLNLKATVLYQ